MSTFYFILSIALMGGGLFVLNNRERTWQIYKFINNNAPGPMPKSWFNANRSIGLFLIFASIIFFLAMQQIVS